MESMSMSSHVEKLTLIDEEYFNKTVEEQISCLHIESLRKIASYLGIKLSGKKKKTELQSYILEYIEEIENPVELCMRIRIAYFNRMPRINIEQREQIMQVVYTQFDEVFAKITNEYSMYASQVDELRFKLSKVCYNAKWQFIFEKVKNFYIDSNLPSPNNLQGCIMNLKELSQKNTDVDYVSTLINRLSDKYLLDFPIDVSSLRYDIEHDIVWKNHQSYAVVEAGLSLDSILESFYKSIYPISHINHSKCSIGQFWNFLFLYKINNDIQHENRKRSFEEMNEEDGKVFSGNVNIIKDCLCDLYKSVFKTPNDSRVFQCFTCKKLFHQSCHGLENASSSMMQCLICFGKNYNMI